MGHPCGLTVAKKQSSTAFSLTPSPSLFLGSQAKLLRRRRLTAMCDGRLWAIEAAPSRRQSTSEACSSADGLTKGAAKGA